MEGQRNETRDIFDVIATYFTNCYWGQLYKHASDAVNEHKYQSIEQAYRTIADQFKIAFIAAPMKHEKINENYLKIINDVHKRYNFYFQRKSTLADFIDVFVKQILPSEFYNIMARQDSRKDEIFRKTITTCVNQFTVFTATEGLMAVTRGRTTREASRLMKEWKGRFMQYLYAERDALYAEFMAKKSGVEPRKTGATISKDAFEALQNQLKKQIFEKAKIQKNLNDYIRLVSKLKDVIKVLEARNEALQAQLNGAPPRRSAPKKVEVIESSESSEPETTEQTEVGKRGLPVINKQQEVVEKEEDIAKELDEVPEYSGEDFVEKDDDELGSDISGSELSADE